MSTEMREWFVKNAAKYGKMMTLCHREQGRELRVRFFNEAVKEWPQHHPKVVAGIMRDVFGVAVSSASQSAAVGHKGQSKYVSRMRDDALLQLVLFLYQKLGETPDPSVLEDATAEESEG